VREPVAWVSRPATVREAGSLVRVSKRRRELNRATLARQMLLDRVDLDPLTAVERLVGLQAQTPHTWYVGLWSRLAHPDPGMIGRLLTERRAVRIALMRSTIHFVSAADAVALRPVLQPASDRFPRGPWMRDLDAGAVVAAGRAILEERARTPSELGALLAELWPGRDPAALAYLVRCLLPVVQTPPRGVWGKAGRTVHAPLSSWVGTTAAAGSIDELVLRYLAAFGPATVKDAQTWSGLTRLGEVFDRLPLVEFGDGLFDLPDAPRPGPDVEAPARLLYDFDNLLLSHDDRSRVLTDEFRERAFAPHGPVPRPVLLDGFTAGAWTVDKGDLTIRTFAPPSPAERAGLEAEGASLLSFLAPTATHDVRLTNY
jgi:winged helix DNA-binding protein